MLTTRIKINEIIAEIRLFTSLHKRNRDNKQKVFSENIGKEWNYEL